MEMFKITDCKEILVEICNVIITNKAYLSEIDGLIGDGDHGINMAKGFSIFKDRMDVKDTVSLNDGFMELANVLMCEIGGSMGPLYGSIFMGMSVSIEGKQELSSKDFSEMLDNGLANLKTITDATLGDKCIMDTLLPAVTTFAEKQRRKCRFDECLLGASTAAKQGAENTKMLQAKIGRASRLGERSIGVLDAGAVSCALILVSFFNAVSNKMTITTG